MHLALAEYPLARQRYEEARPIYHAIGDRLGEANCIQSLGDVHLRLAEYPLARQRYEEARPIYHAIGDRLGEAGCLLGLGDVTARMGDRPTARAAYDQAATLYQAIGRSDWEQVARDRMTRIGNRGVVPRSAGVGGRAGVGSCVAAGNKCVVRRPLGAAPR